MLNRSTTHETSETIETADPTTIEFQNIFGELLTQALADPERRLILVIDNLDRIAKGDADMVWSLLRSFIDIRNGEMARALATAQKRIASCPTPGANILAGVFERLACVDPALRKSPDFAARVMWDLRIEELTIDHPAELAEYLDNPHDYEPPGGWQYSVDDDGY